MDRIAPHINQLKDAGLWISDEIQQRMLTLAGEK
jgi:predicted nucleic acid-binding protein